MTKISEKILKNTRGVTLLLHDPLVVQMLRGHADFFLLDCAARPCSVETVAALQNAAGDTPFLVRPAASDAATLQGLLSLGVDGFVLPDIHYAAELEKIIAGCLYAPEGTRPYRPLVANDVSLEAINDQITFIVEIAHPQAIAQLEHLAEVTGVNGLLVAPERLAVAMERGRDPGHNAVVQALQTVARVAQSYELPWGVEGTGQVDAADFAVTVRDIDLFRAGLIPRDMASVRHLPSKDEQEAVMDMGDFPVFLSARRD